MSTSGSSKSHGSGGRGSTKASSPSSDRRSESKRESPPKSSHTSVDKKKSDDREKRRNRSSSRGRYESSSSRRHDSEKDRGRNHRDDYRSGRDRDKRESKYSSSSSYKDEKSDRRDKYDRHDRKDKRDYEKDRRYRRSSSRDRKRRSSPEKSRRRSRSRSKSPLGKGHTTPSNTAMPVGVVPTMPVPLMQTPVPLIPPVGVTPGVRPLIPNPTAFIPPLMGLQLGPIDLPQKINTSGDVPVDSVSALSRNSLIRSNVKAAQLEKMGIDVLQQTKKATDSVPLPSYYNPGVVNPVRYADQVQKRKLLWSHKTAESKDVSTNISKWEQAKFSQDKDGKVASKFLRLMGVKDGQKTAGDTAAAPGTSGSSSGGTGSGDSIKKQEELFSTMEQQYEVARQVTHTMRGVGLGFSSQPRTF